MENQFFAIFLKQIVFFMSNLHLECFQLSFDIHIVHVGQKLRIFKIVVPKARKFPSSKYATSAPPYGKTMQLRMMFKVSTDR